MCDYYEEEVCDLGRCRIFNDSFRSESTERRRKKNEGTIKKRKRGYKKLDKYGYWTYEKGFYFACNYCYKNFMQEIAFKKLFLSEITGVYSIYPFCGLIKNNQDVVDFGAICLMQGVRGMGKARVVELARIMKAHGYDLNLTGKRTEEGLRLLERIRLDGWTDMNKRTTKEVKKTMVLVDKLINDIKIMGI